MQRFVETQAFARFVDEKTFSSNRSAELAFFDRCCDYEHQIVTVKKKFGTGTWHLDTCVCMSVCLQGCVLKMNDHGRHSSSRGSPDGQCATARLALRCAQTRSHRYVCNINIKLAFHRVSC